MIEPKSFLESLEKSDIRFVVGVPDSLLKSVCAYITQHLPAERHIIATNEGSAVGLAIGQYLASGRPTLVYLQNSGLGNIINPVTSLADSKVYGVPMLFMVGWRGELLMDGTQIHDEPQHIKQGGITREQLDVIDIPYRVVDSSSNIASIVEELTNLALGRSGPVAMLVRKQTFAPFILEDSRPDQHLLTREAAIHSVLGCLPDNVPIVSTTGKTSRELFEFRKDSKKGHYRDFLTVGGMGHASQIATGIALVQPDRKVVCLDGDGAMLMHMGGLLISAEQSNLMHILLDNGAHDSVGGQPTRALSINLANVAKSCGYSLVLHAQTNTDIQVTIESMLNNNGSSFLKIECKRGSRADLVRPDRTPAENKLDFMRFLGCEQ